MKNNFKTYAKKSVSLFLAVLMVMSCWVWMAPEEKLTANAGSDDSSITPGDNYYITFGYNLKNNSNSSGSYIEYKVWYLTNNGTGSAGTSYDTFTDSQLCDTEGYKYYTAKLSGFPYYVEVSTYRKSASDTGARHSLTWDYMAIGNNNGITSSNLIGGTNQYSWSQRTANKWTKARCFTLEGYSQPSNKASSIEKNASVSWPKPFIAGFDTSTVADNDSDDNTDVEINLDKVNGTNKTGKADFTMGTLFDQYGVKWTSGTQKFGEITKSTYISETEDGNAIDESKGSEYLTLASTDTDTTSSGTVTAKPGLQQKVTVDATKGYKEYYLVHKWEATDAKGGTVTSKTTTKVRINYPRYTINFNSGLTNAVIGDSAGNTLGTGTFSPAGYYGETINVPANDKTTAPGYTFYGYWSKPQPASGNASYNAATVDFAQPCTEDEYVTYGGTKGSDEIITDADGKKWYNAGKKLDPTTAKSLMLQEGETSFIENWYGYWLSKDLSVKFYDVDGAFLGEKLVKAGQKYSAITWPTSKYINTGYTSGAFKYDVDENIWVDIDGTEINKTNTNDTAIFSKDIMILTPKITRETFDSKYTVKFIDPELGEPVVIEGITGNKYDYRANLADSKKDYVSEATSKIAAIPGDVSSDLEFRYELLGWSSVEPTTGKNYHVLLEDANFDVKGTAISLNNDWIVRGDATYYPVYRRFTKTYVVEFRYKDATGTDATRQLKVKYGSTLVPPKEYVPYSYVTEGWGYTFKWWEYQTNEGIATFGYDKTISFTNENIQIAGSALDDGQSVKPIIINARYFEGVATPYTVTFNYIDSKGKEDSSSVKVKNEQFILQDTVDMPTSAENWDDGEALYTYADMWEITEGAAILDNNMEDDKVEGDNKGKGDSISTADLVKLSPTSNITLKAVYVNPVPFFTVTYIDGTKTFKARVLQGSKVPAWTEKVKDDNGTPDDTTDDFEEDKIYEPADYEGEGGNYEFQGWFDAATGGKKYTTADFVTSDLTLYSQFKFTPDTFEIKFMNHDGTQVLASGKYEKGQSIESLVESATNLAQGRAEDNTYEYLFLGWDKVVPTFCEGYDVTYTALYKPVYRYYDVKWYNSEAIYQVDENGEYVLDENDNKIVIGWQANKATETTDDKVVEKYLLATTHHTYNSKLYTPSVSDLECLVEAPNGQVYTFAGWYYNDAEGNAVKFERGMVVTAEMEFYATYTLSDKVYTVTTVVKGETTKYDVAAGDEAVIPDPQAGYVDATKHDAFAGWYTDAEYTTEFDAATAINDNITLYAKFTEGEHNFSEKELVSAPTYYAEGEMDVWCACDKAKTKKTEAIDMLTDTQIPTGTIYLGGLDSWSSTDEIGGAALDNGEITLYANANTDVIVTANDTGDVNALYNPSGLGMGIKVIRAFIYPGKFTTLTTDSYGAAQSLTVDVYNDDTQAATNNANFSVKLGDFVVADLDEKGTPQYVPNEDGEYVLNDDGTYSKAEDGDGDYSIAYKDLVSGESYIVYYYVVDKAGNQLRQKVRTAKFIYDDTKPVFTVEGESNDAALPTFCGTATVTGVEAGAVLTVNGEVVTVTDGKYVINYAEGMDNVIITATDKAGNTFSKKIKVADHSYITTEQAASCGVAGYKKVECIICGDVKSEETYDALDHIWSGRQVIPADCVNIGSIIVTCEICGEKVETKYEEDDVTPVIPALGHEYAKDAEGNIIYTTVTEATCKTKGLAEAYCTVCGEGRITKELELDPKNHEDIKETEVLPDCVNNGYYKKTCSCSTEPLVYIDHEGDDKYKVKGHGTIEAGTAEWYVRTEPTCYQTGEKVLKCLVCSNFVEVDGVEVTEEIEATGEHVKTVTNRETYKEDGVVKYHCATEGCTFKYDDKILENEEVKTYDVIFKAEDGSVIAKFEDVVEGTGISSTDENPITAPDKADSADGVYKYTFEGWKDKDGKIYKLPLTVTGNLVLTASYKEAKIMYKHIFKVQTTWTATLATDTNEYETYATLVGAMNDERVPSGTPVFKHKDATTDAALKKLYTFEFKGWKNAKGELVTDFTVAGDAEFTAYFEAVPVTYDVIFYNGAEVIWKVNINGGESAAYENYVLGADGKPVEDEEGNKTLIIPEKAYDKTNHYAFSYKWYTDSGCTKEYKGEPITEKTRLYAGFTATAHSLVPDTTKAENGIIQQAYCLLPEITAKKCSCGYTCEVQTAAALDHNDKVKLEDGTEVINGGNETINDVVYYVVRCSRCNEILKQEKVSSTVKFVNWNDAILGRETYETGKEILMPDLAPERAADDKNTYTFIGWSYKVGETTVFISKDAANLGTATADITFVATYEASIRYYKVTYVDLDNKTLYNHYTEVNGEKIMGVPYGTALPAYAGTTDPATLKGPKYVEAGHYVFDKWQYDASYIVKGDIVVAPEFKLEAHDKETTYTDATCTAMGGQTITCTKCEYKATVNATEPALGHAWNEGVVTTAPDYQTQTPGVMTYTCTRCKDTYTKEIAGNSYSIKATVKDANGNPSANVRVELLKKNEAGVYELHMAKNTGADGVVIFAPLTKGDYRVVVTSTNTHYDATVKEDGTVSGGDITAQPENKPVDNSCKCSCHKENFWGIIYRLIQKIIKFFTGKPSCCACPDKGI